MKNLWLLLLLTSLTAFSQTHQYENLVFEGAGIRGIAYSGVIKQLQQQGVLHHIHKVGGTSAGAITAMMVSLGYTADELYDVVSQTKFQQFNDGKYIFFGGFSRLYRNYGWYRANKFNGWLEMLIERKTGNANITFRELSEQGFKELFVTATCLNKQKLLVFSAETYPDMKIKDAVRISMSIPLYFEAVYIDTTGNVHKRPQTGQNLDLVVDGGLIGNFPIFIFDSTTTDSLACKTRTPNYKTIGVRIDTEAQLRQDAIKPELAPFQINSLSDYLGAFYTMVLENLNRNQLIPEDWSRTISVSSAGIGPKIKRLSSTQKQALVKSGESYTAKFLEKR